MKWPDPTNPDATFFSQEAYRRYFELPAHQEEGAITDGGMEEFVKKMVSSERDAEDEKIDDMLRSLKF